MTIKKKARAGVEKVHIVREKTVWTAWCEWCGKEIVGKRKGTRYCSTTCRIRAHRAKE